MFACQYNESRVSVLTATVALAAWVSQIPSSTVFKERWRRAVDSRKVDMLRQMQDASCPPDSRPTDDGDRTLSFDWSQSTAATAYCSLPGGSTSFLATNGHGIPVAYAVLRNEDFK